MEILEPGNHGQRVLHHADQDSDPGLERAIRLHLQMVDYRVDLLTCKLNLVIVPYAPVVRTEGQATINVVGTVTNGLEKEMGTTTVMMIGQNIAIVFQRHREKLKTGAWSHVKIAQAQVQAQVQAV